VKMTIYDVARVAGVGIGTVSRVLNRSPSVSEETRRRVLEAMEKLSFQPDHVARALSRGRTQAIGVLVPFFTRYFFVEVLRGIETATATNDYFLIIYNVEKKEEYITHLDALAGTRRVDGLLVVSLNPRILRRVYLEQPPFPVVFVDTYARGFSCIEVDHRGGFHSATGHLLGLGHKRIALLDRPEDPPFRTPARDRLAGYRQALREQGVAVCDEYAVMAKYSREGGRDAMDALLSLSEPPTAVVAASDLQAIGAMDAAQERGLRVPEDLAVVGYHDIELAEYIGLTSVRLPTLEMGRRAVDVLVEAIEGRSQHPVRLRMPTELITRRTCGASLGPITSEARSTGEGAEDTGRPT